ncbi:hypothetical protein TWF481_007612 [Arthrobotrys musiformis]|uniref:F-box domain-containing protein n=1 Tax=Arthrobotrys musiformis TaxID=47236 RepID=A0AAV9WDA3_9PEZI
MTLRLLSLPNEILSEIIRHLIPDFDTGGEFKSHKDWRSSPHHNDLSNLILTCKHISAIAKPLLYTTVVVDYHTNMTHLLRTLIENPEIRGLIRTLSIQCPLTFCDELVDPYSPRETFLDDNPELKRKLNMKWDTDKMDEFAAKIFSSAGLDADEFKAFTEDEVESLNDNTYWMAVPSWSERVGYENALIQGIALALISLCTRLERLCLWTYYDTGNTFDFEHGVDVILESEALKDNVLVGLKRLEIWNDGGSGEDDHFRKLFEFPAVKGLIEEGDHLETDDMEFWVART